MSKIKGEKDEKKNIYDCLFINVQGSHVREWETKEKVLT